MKTQPESLCAVYVDLGTTNTRVWLAAGDEVIARASAHIGVRDTAREGSPKRLRAALADLIYSARAEGGRARPSFVVAAGMITSPLGLLEVAHIAAPAGLSELARSVERHSFPDITDLPFLLVPGVRTGPLRCDKGEVGETDVMRGEETLCVGLAARGLLKAAATVLNLGSHWKAIRMDEQSRVESSLTTMSGEMIYAAQTGTILASSVPHGRPSALAADWVEAGMREQRQSGLARALFCVRLLEQRCESTPEERLAFMTGAFISADMDVMVARGMLAEGRAVIITGGGRLAEAWHRALSARAARAVTLSEAEVEQGLLAGLRRVAASSVSS